MVAPPHLQLFHLRCNSVVDVFSPLNCVIYNRIADRAIRPAVGQITRAVVRPTSGRLVSPPRLATQSNRNQLGHRQLHKRTTTPEPL